MKSRVSFFTRYIMLKPLYPIAAFIASAAFVIGILAFGFIINDAISFISIDAFPLNIIIAEFVVLSVFVSFAFGLRSNFAGKLGLSVQKHMKLDFYKSIIKQTPSVFCHFSRSTILNRYNSDFEKIYKFLSHYAFFFFTNVALFAFGLIALIMISLKMLVVMIGVITTLVFLVAAFFSRVQDLSNITNAKSDKLFAHFSETIRYLTTIIVSGTKPKEMAIHTAMYEDYFVSASKKNEYRSDMFFMAMLMLSAIISTIILMGISNIRSGEMDTADIASFMVYTIIVTTAAMFLIDIGHEFGRLASSVERIQSCMQFRDKSGRIMQSSNGIKSLPSYDINFSNVCFSYPGDKRSQVLKNLNLTIREGEKIALVGSSSVGKSTILNLILRLYTINSGSITVGGSNIYDIDSEFWYKQIGYVSQESPVFSRSIEANIGYGNGATKKEISEIMQRFQLNDLEEQTLHDDIGYDDIRNYLSAGEKQRITIARTLLRKDAKIMLFDETLSYLDRDNRDIVMSGIIDSVKDKTAIFVTHYIEEHSQKFDRIINLDEILLH